MIISVLWEDRQGVIARGFGPHELLVSCVADELLASCVADEFQRARVLVKKYVRSNARKGNGNVIRDLQQFSSLSRTGPVCAVIDRDKVRDRLGGMKVPPTCFSGIRAAILAMAPGDYELVLLIENMETLLEECCLATGSVMPRPKPSPDERDPILEKLAWGDAAVRSSVRETVPSFDRLVQWVTNQLASAITRQSKTGRTRT
jgi:hypothetical protein